MTQKLKHITLFLIAAVFTLAIPQASAQTFGGTPIENTAELRYSVNNGPTFSMKSNTSLVVVESFPQMTLTKTASSPVVARGEGVSFKIVVRNTGNVPLTDIEVYDTLDASFNDVRVDKGILRNGVFIWPVEPIRPRSSDSVTISIGYIDAPTDAYITNTAYGTDSDAPTVSDSASIRVTQREGLSAFLTKTGPATATTLDTVTYTINLLNDGAYSLFQTVVVDTIKAPMRLVKVLDGGVAEGNIVRWSLDNISTGDDIDLRVRIAFNEVTSPTPASNTAFLASLGLAERDSLLHGSTATTIVSPPIADLAIQKEVTKAIVPLGDTATYRIRIRNAGNIPLTQVAIADTIPLRFFGIDSISAPGSLSNDSVVVALYDTLMPGEERSLGIFVRAGADLADQPSVLNTAFTRADQLPELRSASAVTSIRDTASASLPSVTFTKTGAATAISADTVTYTITVENTGTRTLRNAVILDTLDTRMTYVSSTDPALVSGRIISWSVGELSPGERQSRSIRVRFNGITTQQTVVNAAGFFADNTLPVGTLAQTVVTPAVNGLQISKSVTSDTVFVGSRIQYVLRVRNTGNTSLTNVSITDTIPSGMIDQVVASSPAVISAQVVRATFARMLPGKVDSIIVGGTVRSGTPSGQLIRNTAYARAAQIPGQVFVSSANAIAIDSPNAGLTFIKKASTDSALLGSQVTYTFLVTNTGNIPVTNISVTDTLPAGIFDRSIVLFPGVSRSNNIVSASFDTLMPGQTDSVYFRLRLESDLPSLTIVTNTAYASAPLLGQSIASSVSVVAYEVIALELTKVASTDTVQVGDTFFYTITARNPGSKDLTNVIVRDTIPSTYLTPISVISNGTLTDGVVTGSFPDIFAEESYEITILVRARADQGGQAAVINRAYASSTETGPTLITDTAVVTTRDAGSGQQDAPSMAFTKTVSKSKINIGKDVLYTMTVRNTGNVPLFEVLVVDTIPALIVDPQVDASGTIVGAVARWIVDTLRVGQTSTFTVTGRVTDTLTSRTSILNRAYALSNQTPYDTASALFTATIPTPDLSCLLHIQVTPRLVIGNGLQAAVIRTFVSDTLGRPKPDGTPVLFKTPIGFFSNGLDSIVVPTVDGYATDSLRAIISSGAVVNIDAVVSIEEPGICSAEEVIKIVFFPGAIAGVVLDNQTRQPVDGAVIIVYNSSGTLIANVTTGPDGTYLIPVPETDEYSVVIISTDRFGDPISVTTTISVNVPGTGGNAPVPTKNLITGKIYFSISGQPVVAQQLKVLLVSEPSNEAGSASSDDEFDRITVFGAVDSTITDSSGTYVFKDVQPGTYTVKIDHPSIGGSMTVGSIIPGQMIVDANIPIVLNTQLSIAKTGPAAALKRDTVTYSIDVANTGTFSVDSVVVTDSLDAAMEFVSATSPSGVMFAYDPLSHQVVWNLGKLDSTGGTRTSASMTVSVRFADSISTSQGSRNTAFLVGSNISPREEAQVMTSIVRPELNIVKTALKRVVEIGDVTTYRISVTNNMPTFPVTNVIIEDMPPFGFSYANGTSFIDSLQLPDPAPARMLTWQIADTLQPGETVTLSYTLTVGAGALEGNGINSAEAIAITASGRPLRSGIAEARVDIRAGVFADRGLIIGKVFYDENRNAYQDSGEVGVKGIEIMTSTGLRVITGDNGKYSIPDVLPGEHVLRVRERSLPPGGMLIEGLNDFAGDARSRFVQVTPSGIARADFYLFQTTPDTVVMEKTIARAGTVRMTRWTDPMNLVFIEDERRAPMKLTGVSFETAKAELRADAATSLGELAEIMREYPDVSMLIVGHTDTLQIRTRQFPNNMVLSLARANSVKQFLFERGGIDSARIRTLGLGELRPVAWNRTRDGRALNRRVEFYFNDDFEPKPLSVASILMEVAIDYAGSVPARSIRFVDELDPRFRYVPGSGLIDDSVTINPTSHNGSIHWTIPNLGKDFSKVLTYRVEIDKPSDEILTAWTTTRDITIATDTSDVISDTTISTINHVAVAVRGRAANFVMSGILFRVGSAELRPAALSALDGAAEYLLSDSTTTLVVEGHTDATPVRGGAFRSNVDLSDARANSVIDILHDSYGIDRSRMKAFGFGALRPVGSNETAEGRERNRRVELRIYKAEFSSNVIQAGRVDSSHASVAELMPAPLLDDGIQKDTVQSGEKYRYTLRVTRPISAKTESIMIVDSLPSSMRLVEGSLEALNGVIGVSGDRVIQVDADRLAEEITVTFVVEITEAMLRDDMLHHAFYVVRNERAGDIIVDKHTTNGNGSRISADN